jgi:hypothetical protein
MIRVARQTSKVCAEMQSAQAAALISDGVQPTLPLIQGLDQCPNEEAESETKNLM